MTIAPVRRLAVVDGAVVVSVDDGEWRRAVVDGHPVDCIENALAAPARLETGEVIGAASGPVTASPAEVRMPSLRGQLYGIGLNYRDHAQQQGYDLPEEPAVFLKSRGAVIGHGDVIELPTDEHGRYEIETELAVVIGDRVRDADLDSAHAAIAGLAVADDVSDRRLQRNGQVALGKGRDTFCPLGPWITLADPDDAGADRRVRTWIDDVLVQDCSTADMVHTPVQLVQFVSRHVTLHPGDIILTGTPGGTAAGLARGLSIRPGATVISEIDGVGRIVNPVRVKGER